MSRLISPSFNISEFKCFLSFSKEKKRNILLSKIIPGEQLIEFKSLNKKKN